MPYGGRRAFVIGCGGEPQAHLKAPDMNAPFLAP